ncbi:MAG: response regulator transcription factor [Planctomycetota bacterium]
MGVSSISSQGPASGLCRIYIADDHPVVRDGYSMLIRREPDLEVCGESGEGAEILRQIDALRPDLCLLDLSLKSGNGLELCKQIRSRFPNVRVLVVSMHDETLYAERVVRSGAGGYISKAEATHQLVHAIRQVLSGEVYLSQRMKERTVARSAGDLQGEGSLLDKLSDRELEVFEQIGQGRTTREIAEKLSLSPKTIESYRENLKAKLNLANSTELTRHAVHWVLERTKGGGATD